MMRDLKTLNITLAVFTYGAVWAIHENLLSVIISKQNPQYNEVFRLLTSAGLFGVIFQILMVISQKFTIRYISEESKIVGSWYQICLISEKNIEESQCKRLRHGPVHISFNKHSLEISAENYKLNEDAYSSSWYSNKVNIDGHQIWLLYNSNGQGRGSTHGHMLFQFQGAKPSKLNGEFADSSPARHHGSMELFRNKSQYEARLQQLTDIECADDERCLQKN